MLLEQEKFFMGWFRCVQVLYYFVHLLFMHITLYCKQRRRYNEEITLNLQFPY